MHFKDMKGNSKPKDKHWDKLMVKEMVKEKTQEALPLEIIIKAEVLLQQFLAHISAWSTT